MCLDDDLMCKERIIRKGNRKILTLVELLSIQRTFFLELFQFIVSEARLYLILHGLCYVYCIVNYLRIFMWPIWRGD